MIASAYPEANRLAYRIRTALTGESTGLQTAKLAWQQAEAVERVNRALQDAAQALSQGTLLDCLLVENTHPRLLEAARSLDHPLVPAWKARCETFRWRVAAPVDSDSVSKIQATIDEQGDLKNWLFKQYRAAVRSKNQAVRSYQIIELIAGRFPDDANAQEELAAKRLQLLAQAAAEVKDATGQLIPAEPPKAIALRYVALGLPLSDFQNANLSEVLTAAAAEHASELAERIRSFLEKAKALSETVDWQAIERDYLACDYALAVNEARGQLPSELREQFEEIATLLSRIRSKYESSISIRLAIAEIRQGKLHKGKPVALASRVAKLKSLETQAAKTGTQIPSELQNEIKAAYLYARRKSLPLYGTFAAALLALVATTFFFVQQSQKQDAAQALQEAALAALQQTEESGDTRLVEDALETWEEQINLAKENSRLANQAALLKDWLFIQTSLETEYTDAVSDLETLATSPDALKNAAAIELLANDLRKTRSDLAPDRGQAAEAQLAELLANYKRRQTTAIEKNRKEIATLEQVVLSTTRDASVARSRIEFETLQNQAVQRIQELARLIKEGDTQGQHSKLAPLLQNARQQLNSVETKWRALENAWLQLAQTKELAPYIAQLERIHSFDILPADQKAALSQTLRLKDQIENLKAEQGLFRDQSAANAFSSQQSYLASSIELSDDERAYLTRLKDLDSFSTVYQSTVQYFEGAAEPQSEYRIYLVEPVSQIESEQSDPHIAFTFSVHGFDEAGIPESSPRHIQFISREDGSFWGFFYKPSKLSPESEYYQRSISNTINHLLSGANRLAILDQLYQLEQQSDLSPAFRVYWQQQFLTFIQFNPWKWGYALSPSLQKHAARLARLADSDRKESLWLSIIEQTVPSPEIRALAESQLDQLPRKEITTLARLYQSAANGRYHMAGHVLADGKLSLLEDTDPQAPLLSVNALTGSIDRIKAGQTLTPYAPVIVYSLEDGETPGRQVQNAEFSSGLNLREPPYSDLLPYLYR